LLLLEVHDASSASALRAELGAAGYSLHRMRSGYPLVRPEEAIPGKAYLVARPPAGDPPGAGGG
jgi:hypothetical protein